MTVRARSATPDLFKVMFKYCPKCAGKLKLEKVDHSKVPVCQKCGFKFFQNSRPTASAVIGDGEGKVMLLKRAIEPHKGKWDIMGGFLENGEEPIAGLQREAGEELDCSLKVGGIIGIYIDKYGYEKGEFYTFNVYYRAELSGGSIKLCKENSEYRWFAEGEIPWDNLAFAQTARALKDYFKNSPL